MEMRNSMCKVACLIAEVSIDASQSSARVKNNRVMLVSWVSVTAVACLPSIVREACIG